MPSRDVNRPTDTEILPAPGGPMGMTLELPVATHELEDALTHDREELVRDALLWQRWVRFVGLFALLLLSLTLGDADRSDVLPRIAVVAITYALSVALIGELVRRSSTVHGSWAPALLVTADITALVGIIALSGGPAHADRVLIGGLLVVQLAVFYFGWKLGTYAALLVGVGYAAVALLPPLSGVGTVALRDIGFSAGMFSLVSALLISAYGHFRERMNQLRLFCKLVEDGDLRPTPLLGTDRRPDDLTLLARSFETMRARLGEQIGTDPLTGCLNRRALETRLRAERRQARRRGTSLAVLAIDIDHFKQINDAHGHPFGDLVLREVSEIMRSCARDTDAVARLGGDEFVVVLPDTEQEGAEIFAERIRSGVARHAFASASATMAITISVGVAATRDTDARAPEALLQAADRSLYKAKSLGRNRVA